MRSLQIAATGMQAQQLNVEVISHNIANLQTTGFKKIRAEFQDLLYQDLRRVGSASSSSGTTVPTGLQLGFGVKTAATSRVMSQGNLVQSQKELDVAVRGEGFFVVNLPSGQTAYTRDGSFNRNENGNLVTLDGFEVQPGITIPTDANNITINQEGQIQAIVGTATTPTVLGQIQLANFANKSGLTAIGDNLYLETSSSGTANLGNPNDTGFGSIAQRFLEGSNVDAVLELSSLITAQRAYELNSKVIQASDEMLSTASNIIR
ncbi:MAG: flagellar basal-body rod protein FlgG [Pseudomonadota bacterium]